MEEVNIVTFIKYSLERLKLLIISASSTLVISLIYMFLIKHSNEIIKNIVICLILSLIVGLGIIFILFILDNTIKDEDSVKNFKIFGVIPNLTKNISNDKYLESINNVKLNIEKVENNKVIMVSSINSREGRSNIAYSLACDFSKEKKVIVLDLDLLNGTQHVLFNTKNEFGYKEALDDVKHIENYIRKVDNIYLLSNGTNITNPVKLFTSKNNEILFDYLKDNFDVIIIDASPILRITGIEELLKFVDVNLLVVEHEKTNINDLEKVKNIYEENNSNITGLIINKSNYKYSAYPKYYTDYYYKK